jgi:hypothetical protein
VEPRNLDPVISDEQFHCEIRGRALKLRARSAITQSNSAPAGTGERRRIVVNLRAFFDPKKRPSVGPIEVRRIISPDGWSEPKGVRT